jgi:initiation factor 1A
MIIEDCVSGKGGKNRRRGKNENENDKRELVFKEDGQEYAQVVKMLGNGRLEANCFDGTARLCHIRGKLRKKAGSISLKYYYESEVVKCYQEHFSKQCF